MRVVLSTWLFCDLVLMIEMLYGFTGIVFFVVPFILVCIVLWTICGPWLGGALIALLVLNALLATV